MPYQVDFTDTINNTSITVQDQELNQSTSLTFVGKSKTGYAKSIADNFLHLLENFSNYIPPDNPVVGQLWYDTDINNNPAQPSLKLWDGVSWIPAGNVIRNYTEPTARVVGDLWVDTQNQQLKLWSGSTWVVVGPEFSNSEFNGLKIDDVLDSVNAAHTILKFVIDQVIVVIVSQDSFVPKIAIDGFPVIYKGINLNKNNFGGAVSFAKFWGVSEKAEALVVASETVTAANFLRGDKESTTLYPINIKNQNGLRLGPNSESTLTTSGNSLLISNSVAGTEIVLRINGQQSLVVSDTTVSLNKDTSITGTLDVDNDLSADNISASGNFTVSGSATMGAGANITGLITANSIIPVDDSTYNLGSSIKKYSTVFADTFGELGSSTFYGEFHGQFIGSVTGSAATLVTPTTFRISGDIVSTNSPDISFNGSNGTVNFTTSLTTESITSRAEATEFGAVDKLLMYSPSEDQLKSLTKEVLFADVALVELGSIIPYSGNDVPDGYLLCNGQEVLIDDYPELFSLIEFKFNASPASGYFAVPDLTTTPPFGAGLIRFIIYTGRVSNV